MTLLPSPNAPADLIRRRAAFVSRGAGGGFRRPAAFTLIELLTVIVLIGVLAAITLGVAMGVRERGAVAQARFELAVLAAALEAYKNQYGDYPQTGGFTAAGPLLSATLTSDNSESKLFNALFGVLGPKMTPLKDQTGADILGRSFTEGSEFTFEIVDGGGEAIFPATAGVQAANAFLDPWGQRYQYYYRNQASPGTWTFPGFVLFSVGPDKNATTPTSAGDPQYSGPNNADNIYAGRK